MRVITRRRVKVRVTVKRSDSPPETQSWLGRRKRSSESENEGTPQQTANVYGEASGTSPAFSSAEGSYHSFDDIDDTYDDIRNTRDDVSRRSVDTQSSMADVSSLRDDVCKEPIYDSIASNLDTDGAIYEEVRARDEDVRKRVSFRLPTRTRLSEFRSHSLPRQRSKRSSPSDKYLDSELSTSLESAINNIGKRDLPTFRGSRERKPSFLRSLESINEDPGENGNTYNTTRGESRKRLSDPTNSACDISSYDTNYSRVGAVPKQRASRARDSNSSNSSFSSHKPTSLLRNSSPSSLKIPRIDNVHDSKSPPVKTHTFTVEFGDDDFANNKRYVSTSLIDVSDRANRTTSFQSSPTRSMSQSLLSDRKDTKLASGDSRKTLEPSEAWRVVKHSSFTVSCDDLSLLCPNEVSSRSDDSDSQNTITERIIIKQSPEGPMCESQLFLNGSQDITNQPGWLSERMSHETKDGTLVTENVSRNIRTGAKIESKTAVDIGDRGRYREGKRLYRNGELIRTSSETVITLGEGK